MLKAGRRAASTLVEADAVVSLQTIGASDRLLGVIAHGGPDDVDQAVQQVVTSVVALAGLALDQGRALTSARATMRAVLVRALDDVRTLAGEYGGLDDQSELSSADVRALDKARSHVEAAGGRAAAAEEASAAPAAAPAAGPTVTAAVGDADARAQASALLAPLIARDRDGVLAASVLVWLEHNGVYDAAARALGVHRHTLTARIRTAERALGNDFASFARRAEVWSALRTLGVTTS